jgi:cytochrome b
MTNANWVKVWDPLVRIFHWSLVVAFFTAYFSGEDLHDLHEIMGYIVLGLVIFRIGWGFVGSEHARFSDFVRGPGEVWRNLRDMVRGHSQRYLGHNPAGGAMVVLLLLMLTATTVTGIVVDEQSEQRAPAATAASGAAKHSQAKHASGEEKERESPLAELHETLANLTLALVLLHIAGVVLGSFAHRENLVAAMFTGRKRM